jgi:ABC-2 type transport system permease protein
MMPVLAGEWLKLRRSRLLWITVLAATIGTAVGGLFMYISINPQRARSLGLLGAKAQLATLAPTWDGYLGLLAQITAVGGALIYGMTMVWIFGREFADHTAKDLLALPTPRGAIVAAKYLVAAMWCGLLTAYIGALGLCIGVGLGIPGAQPKSLWHGLGHLAVAALLTTAVTTTFGLAASVGRGYLPGVGALFAAVFTAQIVAALGYGPWYPYSVPALYAGIAGSEQPGPGPFGFASVAVLAIASVAATVSWWHRADHNSNS